MKQSKLQLAKKKVASFRDKLGKDVDKGIHDTVVMLNALGMHTFASCEGHMTHAYAAPYVDIESPKSGAFAEKRRVAYEKKQDAETNMLTNLICTLNRKETVKLLSYLARFYHKRKARFDERLIINTWGMDYGRLQNQGLEFQSLLPKTLRQKKMRRYQKEMREFTAFLSQQL